MPITLGGHNKGGPTNAASIATAAFSTQPTAGSTIAVAVLNQKDTSETLSSVTDNASGNTYVAAGAEVVYAPSGLRGVVYYAKNINTAASFVVTATFSGATIAARIVAVEIKGADTTAPLGLYGGQSQAAVATTTDAVSTGALGTPAQNGHFVFAMSGHDSFPDSFDAGTGYTVLETTIAQAAFASEYLIQTTAAAVTATFTTNLSGNLVTVGATFQPVGTGTAVLTGTTVPSITEADVVAGGKTIIITLTGDTWVAAGATFDAQRQNIINGIDSAQAEANGWDAEVKAKEVVGAVVRTSNTVVTVTLSAAAAYNITVQETITVTIPTSALVTSTAPIIATPTFAVTAIGGFIPGGDIQHHEGFLTILVM